MPVRYAYGPALFAVGILMLGSIMRIEHGDLTELVPGFVTIVMMVFTYNIANGLTAELVLFSLMKLVAGQARELNRGSGVRRGLCVLSYVFGLPH